MSATLCWEVIITKRKVLWSGTKEKDMEDARVNWLTCLQMIRFSLEIVRPLLIVKVFDKTAGGDLLLVL